VIENRRSSARVSFWSVLNRSQSERSSAPLRAINNLLLRLSSRKEDVLRCLLNPVPSKLSNFKRFYINLRSFTGPINSTLSKPVAKRMPTGRMTAARLKGRAIGTASGTSIIAPKATQPHHSMGSQS